MKLFNQALIGVSSLVMFATANPALAETTLRLAIWDANQKPALDETMMRFSEENPDIKVSIEVVPRSDYVTKLGNVHRGP